MPLRAQVDLIDLVGPLYSGFDNRVAALRLVQKGLCDAALFDPSGKLLPGALGRGLDQHSMAYM